jgi:Leucine-rich repeat (LRR) protein
LKVLWLARSGLSDLDGIPSLTNLQELYLAYNEIQDISPCSMLDSLKVLDLEGYNLKIFIFFIFFLFSQLYFQKFKKFN